MHTFRSTFLFELNRRLRHPAIYLYFLAFGGLAFVSFIGTAGYFDGAEPSTGLQRQLNSPAEINYILQFFNKVFLFLLPAIVGAGLYQDYRHRAHSVLYTYPIGKTAYLSGKFLGGWCVVVLVCLSVGLGLLLAEQLPGLDSSKMGPLRLSGYMSAYLHYVLPNMLAHGALVMAVVIRTRSIYAGFGMVVALLLLQVALESIFAGQDYLIALTDPFGQNTVAFHTRDWGIAERNAGTIPLAGVLLYNRLLWLGIGLGVLGLSIRDFQFSEQVRGLRLWKAGKKPTRTVARSKDDGALPQVDREFSLASRIKTWWKASRFDFRFLLRGRLFVVLPGMGVATAVFATIRVTHRSDMSLQPTTHLLLSAPLSLYANVVLLMTFLYAGMLVHREKSAGMRQLVETCPQASGLFLLAKFSALLKMQLLMLALFMVAGIGMQLANGYLRVDVGLYLFHLYVPTFLFLLIWACAAMLAHTLSGNLYVGIFILVLGWIGIGGLAGAGVASRLLLFNFETQLPWSEMDGYGQGLAAFLLPKIYWLLLGLLLLLLAHLFRSSGFDATLRNRLRAARHRLKGPAIWLSLPLLAGCLAMGLYLRNEEARIRPVLDTQAALADFEARFAPYKSCPQPQITALQLNLDIFPEENRFSAEGSYTLVNRSPRPIDTLLIKTGFDERTDLRADRDWRPLLSDSSLKFHVLHLAKSLAPGDSMQLHFAIRNRPNTLFERNSNVLSNGTFLRSDIFPRLGYFYDPDLPAPEDSTCRHHHYQALDSDRLRFEAVISTSPDQIAVAPGDLLRQWESPGRRHFHYRMAQPIKFGFSFHSARFASQKAIHQGVELEVLHHPGHETAAQTMLRGLKAALEYNTEHFGPYQHGQARVVEFPSSEGSFATSFGNLIPISESRFLGKSDHNRERPDLAFYIPAHELTHQWWGNQLMPARAQGATMLTESVTEYISLNLLRIHQGSAAADRFRQMQKQRYQRGRTQETGTEPPLSHVGPEQEYLAYGKGCLAFQALRDSLGEEELNGLLREFLERHRFSGAPYPVSLDLIGHLRGAVPEGLDAVIGEWFEGAGMGE